VVAAGVASAVAGYVGVVVSCDGCSHFSCDTEELF
jgi:hypothetical protein